MQTEQCTLHLALQGQDGTDHEVFNVAAKRKKREMTEKRQFFPNIIFRTVKIVQKYFMN